MRGGGRGLEELRDEEDGSAVKAQGKKKCLSCREKLTPTMAWPYCVVKTKTHYVSSRAHSRHLPASLAVRCGHVTEFWPDECDRSAHGMSRRDLKSSDMMLQFFLHLMAQSRGASSGFCSRAPGQGLTDFLKGRDSKYFKPFGPMSKIMDIMYVLL